MMKKYKDLCLKAKIDYKKSISKLLFAVILFVVLGIVLFIFYSKAVGVMALLFAFVFIIVDYLNLNALVKKSIASKEIAFNGFYRYLVTLLKEKKVLYAALQGSLEYVDEVLLDDVNELISDIEEDTTLEPFLKFMNNFEDETIRQMIILLYKTQDVEQIDDVLNSINENLIHLQDTSIKTYLSKEEKKIERYYIYPIILSALVMILISMYIFAMIGEGTYV